MANTSGKKWWRSVWTTTMVEEGEDDNEEDDEGLVKAKRGWVGGIRLKRVDCISVQVSFAFSLSLSPFNNIMF